MKSKDLFPWSWSIITQRLESIILSQDAGDWTKNSKKRRRSADHTKERRKVVNVNNAKERRKMGDHTEEGPAKGDSKKDDAKKGTWECHTTRDKGA